MATEIGLRYCPAVITLNGRMKQDIVLQAAVTAGQQKIDSGFEYKSIVEYRP